MNDINELLQNWEGLSVKERQEILDACVEPMLEREQLDVGITMVETPDMCARVGTVPAGAAFIGFVHKQHQIQVISKGSVLVYEPHGVELIEGPATIASPPGTRRLCLVIEEVTWTTILATDVPADEVQEACTVDSFKLLPYEEPS